MDPWLPERESAKHDEYGSTSIAYRSKTVCISSISMYRVTGDWQGTFTGSLHAQLACCRGGAPHLMKKRGSVVTERTGRSCDGLVWKATVWHAKAHPRRDPIVTMLACTDPSESLVLLPALLSNDIRLSTRISLGPVARASHNK